MSSASKPSGQKNQKGGFVLGLIVGLLIGLSISLGVALYINKTPIPFMNKVPQRTAEQDAQETERNKNWDPNAPLAGKAGRSASGVVNVPPPLTTPPPPTTTASAAVAAASAAATLPAPAPTPKPAAAKADAPASTAAPTAAAGGDAFVYFVQAGAFTRPEEAEAQRAKLALQGFTAKVMEREQNGRTVYRVRLGPSDTREAAEELQRKIEGAGFEANLVRVQR